MGQCEHCGGDLADDQLHVLSECFTHLYDRIDKLEEENRGLKQAVEAYKRQLKKITATAPPSVV